MEPLPQLRPVRVQGRAYYQELRRILDVERPMILGTLARWRADGTKLTPALVGALALRHELNFKAMCGFLEDENIIPCGTYDRITRQHRPTAVLRAGQEWLKARDGDDVTAMEAAFRDSQAIR